MTDLNSEQSDTWSDPESAARTGHGSKGKQRDDTEDRAAAYRAWRWDAGFGCVTKVEQVEWRYIRKRWRACAVLELTRYDGVDRMPSPKYLAAIVARMTKRDRQAKLAVQVGHKLGCDAFVILFRSDLQFAWGYNLTLNAGPDTWKQWMWPEYQTWLKQIEATWERRRERREQAKAAKKGNRGTDNG